MTSVYTEYVIHCRFIPSYSAFNLYVVKKKRVAVQQEGRYKNYEAGKMGYFHFVCVEEISDRERKCQDSVHSE